MSDEALRTLERQAAATGAPEDQGRLLLARIRAGLVEDPRKLPPLKWVIGMSTQPRAPTETVHGARLHLIDQVLRPGVDAAVRTACGVAMLSTMDDCTTAKPSLALAPGPTCGHCRRKPAWVEIAKRLELLRLLLAVGEPVGEVVSGSCTGCGGIGFKEERGPRGSRRKVQCQVCRRCTLCDGTGEYQSLHNGDWLRCYTCKPIKCTRCNDTGRELIDCAGSAGYRACSAGCEGGVP